MQPYEPRFRSALGDVLQRDPEAIRRMFRGNPIYTEDAPDALLPLPGEDGSKGAYLGRLDPDSYILLEPDHYWPAHRHRATSLLVGIAIGLASIGAVTTGAFAAYYILHAMGLVA